MTDPTPTLVPVPVNEQQPESHLAWWYFQSTEEDCDYWVLDDNAMEREPQPTHWLPAHALPLPEVARDSGS